MAFTSFPDSSVVRKSRSDLSDSPTVADPGVASLGGGVDFLANLSLATLALVDATVLVLFCTVVLWRKISKSIESYCKITISNHRNLAYFLLLFDFYCFKKLSFLISNKIFSPFRSIDQNEKVCQTGCLPTLKPCPVGEICDIRHRGLKLDGNL